jgi:threonine-phosphate decarboxylase
MKHGGDILTYKHLFDGEIIDFSSNINPLGPPSILKDKLIDGLNNLVIYPDIKYRLLKEEIAKYLGCSIDEVILGNGAVDIINTFSLMFNRVIVFKPCFSEYIDRPKILGKEVIVLETNKEFNVEEDLISRNVSSGDLVILGNPNNPTGKRIKANVVLKIYEMIEEKGAFLLLDEAFFEFCPADYDSIKLFSGRKNLCVIRAATKFFGLPGIRLGYAFTNCEISKTYNELSIPWNINTYAEIAGRCILSDTNYIIESREYIDSQRKFMFSKLKEIENIQIFDSDANFILIKLLEHDEDFVFNFLIKRGILIRKASSFEGLDKTYIRIAVKDHENNLKLLKYLKECLVWKA